MSSSRARRSGSGGRQFAVGGGRWRHVAVVDTGCGCRQRRPRLPLMSLPSFLRPSPKPPVPRSSSSSRSSSFFPSSASTASSACTYSSSSNYAANYSASSHVYQEPAVPYGVTAAKASASARKKVAGNGKARKRREKTAVAAEEDVGVAVEKESSDPRADFRDSMVQMVVEMGLCDWDGLRCMLRRLLALNAPRHHAAILAAFAEVCAQLASEPPPSQQPAYHYDYYY